MFDQLKLLLKKPENFNSTMLQDDENHVQHSQIHQLSSLLSATSYSLAEKMFNKQTEKQVIAGVEAEDSDLGKAFLPLSSTFNFPLL